MNVKRDHVPLAVKQLQKLLAESKGMQSSDVISAATGIHAVTLRKFRSTGQGISLAKMETLAHFFGYQITVTKAVTL
jgi:hypothetical protein